MVNFRHQRLGHSYLDVSTPIILPLCACVRERERLGFDPKQMTDFTTALLSETTL